MKRFDSKLKEIENELREVHSKNAPTKVLNYINNRWIDEHTSESFVSKEDALKDFPAYGKVLILEHVGGTQIDEKGRDVREISAEEMDRILNED